MSTLRRKTRVGQVVSDKSDKTVVVAVEWRQRHPLYRKSIRRISRFSAHDEHNTCRVGDQVRIVETRPLSRTKRWRILEILMRREVPEIQPREIAIEVEERAPVAAIAVVAEEAGVSTAPSAEEVETVEAVPATAEAEEEPEQAEAPPVEAQAVEAAEEPEAPATAEVAEEPEQAEAPPVEARAVEAAEEPEAPATAEAPEAKAEQEEEPER